MASAEDAVVPQSPFDGRELVASLPHRPGVYRMFDAAGATLYVGKARDLKKRVASYFQKGAHETRIALMLSQVARVETTVTRSEGEALLLENNLIKADEPRYNILFRDDKSYPYVCISGDPFPQLRFHRGALDRRHRYFGPFPSAGAVRDGIATLQKVFMLRTCENTVFANRSRPCMLHQIERCTAPCVGLVSKETYLEDVRHATLFLEGKNTQVIDELVARMELASTQMHYEQAARYRDQIASLKRILDKQYMSGDAGDLDSDGAGALDRHDDRAGEPVRRDRGRERGQALVEFSLAIIVFLTLMMGIVDFGRAIYQYNGVSQAAREIARATAAHPGSDFTSNAGRSSETLGVIATQKGLIPNLQDPTIKCVEVDGTEITTHCVAGKWIQVRISAPYTPVTPILGLTGTWDFFSSSTSVQLQ